MALFYLPESNRVTGKQRQEQEWTPRLYICKVISYQKFVLSNGLRVIHHYDPDSTVVVLNTLYNVGARDESPERTGFAHLFEHLMFGGSLHVAEYDKEVERAGGSNNAFTNNEYTNYYITVPAENAETAFWLESDRMLQLDFSPKSLEVQRGVVIEEFKQRCFNAPFGQLWHHIRHLLYTNSTYRWPTIGDHIEHIATATLEDVEQFYYKHYHPANAVLCVAGAISLEETKRLTEKWYGDITRNGTVNQNQYPEDAPVQSRREMKTEDLSPNPAVFLVWRGPVFSDPESAALEMYADLLGGSEISPLYLELVKQQQLFNVAECFYMRGIGEGMFVLYGILNEGVSHETGEAALWEVLQRSFEGKLFTERNLEMVKNKATTSLLFEKTTLINRAQKLCFFENLNSLDKINQENDQYRQVQMNDMIGAASATFQADHASVIYYSPKSKA